MAGATGSSYVPAAPTAPAPAAASGSNVSWTTSWGPHAFEFFNDGRLAEWGVRFQTGVRSQWLIQHIQYPSTHIEHCDGSAYPDTPPLYSPVTPDYYEAWWIDGNGDAKIPTSLGQVPTFKEPFGYAHDLWKFNSNSSKPTQGTLMCLGDLFVVGRLPLEFGFGNVPDAVALPSAKSISAALGSPVAPQRTALVAWDYCNTPGTVPGADIFPSKE